jgi:hypothetical protein
MKRIPESRIPKQNNYGDSFGDFIESYNLDLTSNFGAIRTTRTKLVTSATTVPEIARVVGFAFYNNDYFALTENVVLKADSFPSDSFVVDESANAPSGELSEIYSDIEIFNNAMYVSGSNEIMKLSGTTWSTPITTQLTSSRPHLLKAYGSGDNARLYVTDDYYKVHSVSTADAISATGSYTLDLKLSNEWVITMLEAAEDALWVGLLNEETGAGLIVEWDGITENIVNRQFQMSNGIVAGAVLNNTPYAIDTRGRLLQYNGSTFAEVDRFNLKRQYLMRGAGSITSTRFMHPNGITVTDYGSLLIAFNNDLTGTDVFEESCPSGIYEYHPETGLNHKYSVSVSPVGAVSYTDYGHTILGNGVFIDSVFFRRPVSGNDTANGTLLIGAEYETQTATTNFAIFCDDSLDTTPKMGYLKTPWMWSDNIIDTWQKVYALYRKFRNETDKIVVKYRTVDVDSVTASFYWTDERTLVTTDDISDFAIGDEVMVTNGAGAGQVMTITNIQPSVSTYTVTVDSNEFDLTTPFVGRLENFTALPTITSDSTEYTGLTIPNGTSPRIQFKVYLYFTGEQELHKLHIVNKNNINE